ncbi:MAG: helix-turn-helix domain-containing protein, partial [Nevskia sp.]|nr:helix-turn-helix domain-containing protein [Nevskia sp.]
ATHRDLRVMVDKGSFREDQFYRIGVVPVHLPPLRERLSDILPLAEHFLVLSGSSRRLSAQAAARLLAHPWPGNVRELRNAIERAAVLAPLAVLSAVDFDFLESARTGAAPAETDWLAGDMPGAVARLESAMIRRALANCGGNRTEAARQLGIHRQLLYEKLRRYGLEASANRTEGVGEADEAGRSGSEKP